MRLWFIFLILISVPAVAQTTSTIRDKVGNPVARTVQQGNRTYLTDTVGNKKGYSQQLPNGTTEFRDNSGNLIGTQTPR
jgi:hypothetical protein